MTDTTVPRTTDLGTVIKSTRARTAIYGAYVVGLVLVGAATAAFSQLGGSPDWLGVVESVMLYLGVPVGTLAAVNTKAGATQTYVVNAPMVQDGEDFQHVVRNAVDGTIHRT